MQPFRAQKETVHAPVHLSLVFTRKWKTRGMNLIELAILSLPSSHYKWARSERAFKNPWLSPNKLFLTPSKGNRSSIKFNVTQRKFLILFFRNFNDLYWHWGGFHDMAWSQLSAIISCITWSTRITRDWVTENTKRTQPQGRGASHT